jgi:hypothetical protein
MRAALIKCLEERTSEAIAQERRLACAITGEDLPNE